METIKIMGKGNRDVEDFLKAKNRFTKNNKPEKVSILLDEYKGHSSKAVAYGDKGKNSEWEWFPKSLIESKQIVINELSNGFEIIVPHWLAKEKGHI
jgi:hypothetical protein